MTVLAWQRGGTPGGRAVVLVHDWAASGGVWQEAGWPDALRGLDVLVCDLPGHAESADVPLPAARQPAAWTAELIWSDLQRLRVGSAAVVGVGVGGVVAAHLAVQQPAGVHHVVLIGADDRVLVANREEIAAALRDPAAPVWHPDAAAAVSVARSHRASELPTLARWVEAVAWPAAARLGALRTPVLLATGRDDPRHERAPRLAALFHAGRLLTVAGDATTALASAELARAVAAFVAEDGP